MVREDLIVSAVSFLQDPSVASAPLDKRIAFLQSKNLTQEEIDVSLARAAEDPSHPSTPASSQASAPANYAYRQQQQPPPPPAYGAYPPGYWQQPPPPPEPPKRDWRDYFIMATVMGGVSYGLYFTAKRYILPLISPPTPPQLEQDKASIDASFTRAFDLLDQLNTDTTALKASEEARTSRLDTALGEMECVLASLKESSKRQADDNRRIENDVRGLRDLIPKALDAQKEASDARLKELGTELKSLKTLVGNRMGAGTARPPAAPTTSTGYYGSGSGSGSQSQSASGIPPVVNPLAQPTTPSESTGASANGTDGAAVTTSSTSAPAPERSQTSSPYGRMPNGRAAIPAWQMAANKKNEEAKKKEEEAVAAAAKKDTSESGTAVDAAPGS